MTSYDFEFLKSGTSSLNVRPKKRILNRSRGPAVWALRAQTDKRLYARKMLKMIQEIVL